MTNNVQEATKSSNARFLRIKGFDYIELYVGNVPQAAHYYRTAFGFKPIAYAGLETGMRDRVSLVLEQRNIRLMLTGALEPNNHIAEYCKLHGDGVRDIAFSVPDATQAFRETVKRGAKPVLEPILIEDKHGQAIKAIVGTCADMVHSLIQRDGYSGAFLPGFQVIGNLPPPATTGLASIDHIAINLATSDLDYWLDFYQQAMGFHETQCEAIATDYSAMTVRVLQNSSGSIKFSMVAPVAGAGRSQIEEFLTYNHGPGVQHVALSTTDIVKTVRTLRERDIEFIRAPDTYYGMLRSRVGDIREDIATLHDLNILVDRDERGYLLQTFTKPVQSRPTMFWEVIQRRGSLGFGGGNIKALFEAVEHEQRLRGNL